MSHIKNLSQDFITWAILKNRNDFDDAFKNDNDNSRMRKCIERAYELGCKAHIEELEADMPHVSVAPVVVESCGVAKEFNY